MRFMPPIQPLPTWLSSALPSRFATAQAIAADAAALAMDMRPPPGAAQATLKARQDWLTEADGAVEHLISDRLRDAFPDDGFQGEEAGRTREGALRWVVDPIDGTSNFARGAPRWAVSIALVAAEPGMETGVETGFETGPIVLLGVLAAPALGETFAACHGGAATLNGVAIHAAATDDPARAIVECGWSPRVPQADYLALCERAMAAGAMLRSGGSGALGLADVAAGRIDAYAERHINLWDCAAALAILGAAGAAVTPFLPRYAAAGGPLLAAAPALAAAMAEALGFGDPA